MELISFSYKKQAVPEADLVIDCRDLLNPHRHLELKSLDGRDHRVQQFVLGDQQAHDILADLMDHKYPRKDIKRIAFGCVGGRHRSVAMAEVFAERLKKLGENPLTTHLAL